MRNLWLSIGSALFIILMITACAHDTEWLSRARYPIIALDTAAKTFTIDGVYAAEFKAEGIIVVTRLNESNAEVEVGQFTVTAAFTALSQTYITVEETIPEEARGGVIQHGGDVVTIPDPTELKLYFRTEGVFDPSTWYYIVFNFSQATSTAVTEANTPLPELSNEDRGKNWEMYVLIHQDENGSLSLETNRRSNLPTVLLTDAGPSDATTGDFNSDGLTDIALACQIEGTVQLLLGAPYEEITYRIDLRYWEEITNIDTGAGPAPLRIHATDLTGDTLDDLLVLYASGGTNGGLLRVLAVEDLDGGTGDGIADGTFRRQGSDLSLPVTPVDWLCSDQSTGADLDFNGDTFPDVAVLGTGAGGAQVLILTSDATGEFSIAGAYDVGADPAALAGGILIDDTFDLVAGCNSGAGGTGEGFVLTAVGDGTFAPGPVLPVEAALTDVEVARLFGSANDIVIVYNTDEANVAIFNNEADEFFTAAAEVVSYAGAAYQVLPHDASSDNRNDLVIVDGIPGEGNHTMFIVDRDDTFPSTLRWKDDVLTYLMGEGPSRIHLADLDNDGKRDDFVIPNSSDNDFGNSVNLVYGLGKNNYTDAERYWVDLAPQLLQSQEWYLRHIPGPNSFELVIDPRLFYNLALEEIDRFTVDFMTGNTAIDFERNQIGGSIQQGEIIENMIRPFNVPVEVDFTEDEAYHNLVLEIQTNPAADLTSWFIEVI